MRPGVGDSKLCCSHFFKLNGQILAHQPLKEKKGKFSGLDFTGSTFNQTLSRMGLIYSFSYHYEVKLNFVHRRQGEMCLFGERTNNCTNCSHHGPILFHISLFSLSEQTVESKSMPKISPNKIFLDSLMSMKSLVQSLVLV